MIDIKKLDEKDVVFLNVKPSKEEDLEFSNFLKSRKTTKTTKTKTVNTKKRNKKQNA